MPTVDAFEAAVGRHDARVAALGPMVWVGSEPTFTDRHAQTPEWISQALGGEKEERALAATAALCRRFPGAVVLRSVGRQYPGEDRPRWSLGLYRRRDGQPLWAGPPDPLVLPLDHGPRAQTTPGENRMRKARYEAQVKACTNPES